MATTGSTTISIRVATKMALARFGNKGESYDDIIHRIIRQALGGRPLYAADIRLALTPDDVPPDYTVFLDRVRPIVISRNPHSLYLSGSYALQIKKDVEERLVWLEGLKEDARVGIEITKDGEPVARIRPVFRHLGSLRRRGDGFSIAFLLDRKSFLDRSRMDPPLAYDEWKRRGFS